MFDIGCLNKEKKREGDEIIKPNVIKKETK